MKRRKLKGFVVPMMYGVSIAMLVGSVYVIERLINNAVFKSNDIDVIEEVILNNDDYLEEIINDIHEAITGSEYYNEHFKDVAYIVDKHERLVMNELRSKIDKSLNEYIIQINNARKYYVWETMRQEYLFESDYLRESKAKYPRIRTIGKVVLKLVPFVTLLIIISLCVIGVSNSFRNNEASLEKANAMTLERVTNLLDRMSSIDMSLQKTSQELEKLTILDSNIVKLEIRLTNDRVENNSN